MIDETKLNSWAEGLLDMSKANNLINFKDTKSGSLDIIYPDFNTLFEEINSDTTLEVYDPKLDIDDVEQEDDETCEEYLKSVTPKIKKNNQIVVFHEGVKNPIPILKQIKSKAMTVMTETSVNISYIATGFILWKEKGDDTVYNAPILLTPINIVNNSTLTPYYITTMQDETLVNPTFSYKLQSEHNVTLPELADSTIDEYLVKIEEIVKKLGWSVNRSIKIGIFSFLKMNMYFDLKTNAAKIAQHKNIRALFGDVDSSLDNATTRKELDLTALHPIVDADSSQARAMQMAKDGVTFVLQGPPGTGKSQSITNIIAECIYAGKKVLFVSEKLAALNVVYDKLKKNGLDDFCLELHSHKSNKKEVVKELCRVLTLGKMGVSPKAERELAQIGISKAKLDEYTTELHKEIDVLKRSLFEVIVEYNKLDPQKDVGYVIRDIQEKGDEYLTKITEKLEHYVEMIPYVGDDYRKNCWFGYIKSDTSYTAIVKLKDDLTSLLSFLTDLKPIVVELTEKFNVNADSVSLSNKYAYYFNFLSGTKYLTPSVLHKDKAQSILECLNGQQEYAKRYLELKSQIDNQFEPSVFEIDPIVYDKNLRIYFDNGFKRLFSKEYKKISLAFKSYNKKKKKLSYAAILDVLAKLIEFKNIQNTFVENEKLYKNYLTENYDGVNTDFVTLLKEINGVIEHNLPLGAIASKTPSEYKSLQPELHNYWKKIKKIQDDNKNAIKAVYSYFDPKDFNMLSNKLDTVIEKFTLCIANIDEIVNWINFYNLFKELRDLDAADYLPQTIDQEIDRKEIVGSYRKIFFKEWFDYLVSNDPALNVLQRILHDKTVDQFAEKDALQFNINKAKIKAEVSAKRPDLDLIASGSPVSVLLREGEKKKKHKPIRQLLEEIPELVQTIKPCFLMSPLSVSTFLGPDFHFDTVIFDEASQIFPQDAVGAIYRADQLICVGDSKQMPPTNFFTATINANDNFVDDDINDYESILDLCNTAFPQIYLKWHYRSKYEELIDFSNKNFYAKQLVTFPSCQKSKEGIGIDYYQVDGQFEHTSAINKAEAEKVVELVYQNIEKYPDRSLGVIAFSTRQQALIEKELWKKRKQNPDKEPFFSSDKDEPFFIKNLETVQGDERDSIILSVAYGKDQEGKVLHNFGPLNRVGGERRLNVAISRAKCNMQVVSSMTYTDIDISKTKSNGARLLKEYLKYAQLGFTDEEEKKVKRTLDDEFCDIAVEYLKEKGYQVERNVGLSDRKIDIAIKLPDQDAYSIAIECDGLNYTSFETTTDRDRLRKQNLNRMGWDYYRLWSVDWCKNNSDELKRLNSAVKKSIDGKTKSNDNGDKKPKEPIFDIPIPEKTFEFTKYKEADIEKLKKKYKNNFLSIVKGILDVESPLSEELLIKKMLYFFDKDKVTQQVTSSYKLLMKNCETQGIIRKNDFLYLQGQTEFPLRVFEEGQREVKYIALEELANGLMEVIKRNGTADKISVYKTLCSALGYQRIGEAVMRRLEIALSLNSDILDITDATVKIKG